MKKDKSKFLAIFLVFLTILVVVISSLMNKNKQESTTIDIVRNPSEFFTINSCIYRVITYIQKEDATSLLQVLSEKYKKDNKINNQNVLSVFSKLEKESTFKSMKMYYEKIDDNITKYYVYGKIEENLLHDYSIVEQTDEKETYFVVYLDKKKQIFSIEPYDGYLFLEGEKNGQKDF